MSHHFDTPTGREDPKLNLCDLYLFAGRPGSTVMVMTVNPEADPAKGPLFRDEGLYVFRFDTNGHGREDVSFKVQFGETNHGAGGEHVQNFEVRRAIGDGAGHGADGDLVAAGTTSRIVTADSGVRVFTGLTQDVFAGDSAALRAFEAAFAEGQYKPEAFDNHVNFFAPRRVAAIVLEVPNELIGVGLVQAWATISLFGHAPEQQVARWGLPLITHLYARDDDLRETYNRTTPSGDNAAVLDRIGEVIRETTFLAGTANDPQAYAQRVLDRFGALTLPYELGTPASFDYVGFNGRTLHDDVMDVMLSLTTNSPLGDGANPDPDRISMEFPYVPVPDRG
ncbi:hypothetical protein GCM10023322_52600 [Rugosimonospora acidiphila]|uniref:DUF4331 domain-containing protein n=1 Tax=Rugosimonospora acidiphila TaxID=556531 RepID=A0ABP9SAH4_9ACTN